MSTKKNLTGQEKLAIVLQGLKGNCRISELCNEYGISQGMFYKWLRIGLAIPSFLSQTNGFAERNIATDCVKDKV